VIAIEAAMVAGSNNWRTDMAHIGTFKESSNGGFEGEVFMPPLNAKGVRIAQITTPNANKKAPTHRILLVRSDYAKL
jgi:uncharacterized protein (DUF736 family)